MKKLLSLPFLLVFAMILLVAFAAPNDSVVVPSVKKSKLTGTMPVKKHIFHRHHLAKKIPVLTKKEILPYNRSTISPIIILLFCLMIFGLLVRAYRNKSFEIRRLRRRDYYRNVYLQSEAWKRKRFVVLRRDNWRCVHCGAHATEVHHKRYARWNIGREPIEWLESVCRECHEGIHGYRQ